MLTDIPTIQYRIDYFLLFGLVLRGGIAPTIRLALVLCYLFKRQAKRVTNAQQLSCWLLESHLFACKAPLHIHCKRSAYSLAIRLMAFARFRRPVSGCTLFAA